MKTYDYIIVLKKRSFASVDLVSQIMLVIAAIAFVAAYFTGFIIGTISIVMAIAVLAWLVYCIWQNKRGIAPFYRFGLLIGAIGWYSLEDGIWVAWIYLLAAMLEKQVKFPEEIAFDENEIVKNSFPKKRYSWSELNNVVLKDGLLTIDFKNNQLIQKELESNTTEALEHEFNAYAKLNLEKTTHAN